jgi:hypothetical protein
MTKKKSAMTKRQSAKKRAQQSIGNFYPGPAGTCEARLYEFSNEREEAPEGLDPEKPIETTHRIAAGSMLEAMEYMAEFEPEFNIHSVRTIGIIVLLSGSRYN